MAKKAHGAAPGTNTRGNVRSTLDSPFSQGSNKGSQSDMGGIWPGRTGGDNGLPTHVYDSMGGPKSAPSPSDNSSLGTIKTSRKE